MQTGFDDFLTLEVNNLHVDVLTGIYSEETHLPDCTGLDFGVI